MQSNRIIRKGYLYAETLELICRCIRKLSTSFNCSNLLRQLHEEGLIISHIARHRAPTITPTSCSTFFCRLVPGNSCTISAQERPYLRRIKTIHRLIRFVCLSSAFCFSLPIAGTCTTAPVRPDTARRWLPRRL